MHAEINSSFFANLHSGDVKIVVIGGWAPSLIRFRAPLLQEMVARGHDVHAWAPEGTAALRAQLSELGVKFESLTLERAGLSAIADARALVDLTRRLRATRPDLLFTYTIKPIVYGAIAARLGGQPSHAALVTGLGWAFTGPAADPRRRRVRAIASRLYRYALDRCDVIFLQNPDDIADLVAHGALAPDAPVHLVRGSGVDLTEFPATPLPPPPVRFLFMGRLLRDKGIYEYVEAARLVRRTHAQVSFAVLGWTDSNPASVTTRELESWVREGTVEYLGTKTDVRSDLAACHVLVLPSYREGTPRSVLEAMSMGRAVITTDVPGCRQSIVHDETGLVVPVRNPDALAHAAELLIRDPTRLHRFALAARTRAEALYDARKIAASMLDALGC